MSTDADAELAAAIEQLKMENDELAKRLEFVKEATVEQVCPSPTLGRAVPGCAVPRRHTTPPRTACAHTERTWWAKSGSHLGELGVCRGRPFADPRQPTFRLCLDLCRLTPFALAPKVEARVRVSRRGQPPAGDRRLRRGLTPPIPRFEQAT